MHDRVISQDIVLRQPKQLLSLVIPCMVARGWVLYGVDELSELTDDRYEVPSQS